MKRCASIEHHVGSMLTSKPWELVTPIFEMYVRLRLLKLVLSDGRKLWWTAYLSGS